MLIVLAKAKVGEGAMEPARAAIADMVAASNAEAGCIAYAFTQDVLDPSVLHIVEKWVDDAALAAHFATPHMAAFLITQRQRIRHRSRQLNPYPTRTSHPQMD